MTTRLLSSSDKSQALFSSSTEIKPKHFSVSFNTGDVILLGKTNMLRFNHPQEAAKLRKKRYVSGCAVRFSKRVNYKIMSDCST